MKTKTIITMLLAAMLAFSFTACNGKNSCTHVDKDDNGKCDLCSEDFSDGDEVKPDPTVTCTFTLVTDKNLPVANAEFELSNDTATYALKTNESGVVSQEIKLGTYSISYNFETLPAAHMPAEFEVTLTSSTTAITLLIEDNTPDGSFKHPFFINDSVTALELAGGAQVYYTYRAVGVKTVEIPSEHVTVEYNGTTYAAEDGKVSFNIQSQMMSMVQLCVKNTSTEAVSTQISIVSAVGTAMDNPIILTEDTATASVPLDEMVYYKWVATQSGNLVVSSDNPYNNISLSNLTTGQASASTNGEDMTYVEVNVNDEIIIVVAALSGEALTEIEFFVEYA